MAGPVSKVLQSSLRLISREVVMDSALKSHLGIRAAPIPLLIRGTAFERLADSPGTRAFGDNAAAQHSKPSVAST